MRREERIEPPQLALNEREDVRKSAEPSCCLFPPDAQEQRPALVRGETRCRVSSLQECTSALPNEHGMGE